MNRLEEKYRKEVVPSLMERHNYKTVMLVPKLEKIVVNMGVGDAIVNSKNLENAVADLEKAIELDDKFVSALFAMGAAQKKLGNYNKSLEYLDRVLAIEPDAIMAKALKKLILQKYL